MTIPGFQEIMLPMLILLADNQEHSLRETIEQLTKQFKVTQEELKELLPSGHQPIFHNRVGWSRTYMKKAGLIKSTRRGYFQITDRGTALLEQNPQEINIGLLNKYPEFVAFHTGKKPVNGKVVGSSVGESEITPQEMISNAMETIKNDLASDLLEQLKIGSPQLFENIVVDLLVKMGYGGSWEDAAKVIGKSGDEGIDGIINEDKLGLDVIYIQAKRWENSVSRPEIQKFAGALMGQQARKGVFITTSTFTSEARNYAAKVDTKIVLIDGKMLVDAMIEYGIGVSTTVTYAVKKIDQDYFSEE